jgi:hypothetical protein
MIPHIVDSLITSRHQTYIILNNNVKPKNNKSVHIYNCDIHTKPKSRLNTANAAILGQGLRVTI